MDLIRGGNDVLKQMGYQDIKLTIAGNSVVISESPVGTASFSVSDPNLLRMNGETLNALGDMVQDPDVAASGAASGREVLRTLGQTLFELTLGTWNQLRYAADVASRNGDRLRIVINCQEAAVGALPWELLLDPNVADYIALASWCSLVRAVSGVAPVPRATTSVPLRILICAAHPSDQGPLTIAEEVDGLIGSLEPLREEGLVEVYAVPGQFETLVRALEAEGPWHVLHFIGHGGFTPGTGGILVFEKNDGTSGFVDANQFARVLRQHETLQLVLLSSCRTGASAGSAGVVSTAEVLVREANVAAVLTMQFKISNWAATKFAAAFYGTLARSGSVESAAADARLAVAQAPGPRGLPSLEWATPILYLRGSGVVFDLQVSRRQPPLTGGPRPMTERVEPTVGALERRATLKQLDRLDWQLTTTAPGDYSTWLERARSALTSLGASNVQMSTDNTLRARLGGFAVLGAFGATEEVSVRVIPLISGVELTIRSHTIQRMLFDGGRNEAFVRNLAAQLEISI